MTPGYSHEATVAAITSYYKFLQNLYLPEDVVIYPPATGWSNINSETMAPLQKTEVVIKLLQHIPYLHDSSNYALACDTWPIEYCYEGVQAWMRDPIDKWRFNPMVENGNIPPHVVTLARGRRDAYYILIDTVRGVVVWGSPGGGWVAKDKDGENLFWELVPDGRIDPDGPDWWMDDATLEVEEFFEYFKDKFRKMEWMPSTRGPQDVHEVDVDGPDEDDLALMKILRDAGWPSDGEGNGWNRDEAIRRFEDAEEVDIDGVFRLRWPLVESTNGVEEHAAEEVVQNLRLEH